MTKIYTKEIKTCWDCPYSRTVPSSNPNEGMCYKKDDKEGNATRVKINSYPPSWCPLPDKNEQ